MEFSAHSPLYLDHAATTPLVPAAAQALTELTEKVYGNPSSTHLLGRKALECLEDFQERLARILDVPPSHIIFTSGGTESSNLAIWGSIGGISQGIDWLKLNPEGQLLTTVNEHDATKKTIECLEHAGAHVQWLTVDHEGFLKTSHLEEALRKRTKLLTLHHAQNEVGTVQDIKAISKTLRALQPDALLHIDAVQSFLKMPFSLQDLDVDMISLSAHKVGGPKGVGALVLGNRFVNKKPKLGAFITGSSQQNGIRPGTIPVPLIGSFISAVEWGHKNFEANRNHILKMRTRLLAGLPARALLNGPSDVSESTLTRTPQTINFSVQGFPSGMLVEAMSSKYICISAGSACHSASPKPNETICNLGHSKDRALSAIRVSLSHSTKEEEIDYFLNALNGIIAQFS